MKVLIGYLLVLLGFVYLFLSLTAYKHTKKDLKKGDRILAISPWWPTHDIYDDEAKHVVKAGQFILVILIIGTVLILI